MPGGAKATEGQPSARRQVGQDESRLPGGGEADSQVCLKRAEPARWGAAAEAQRRRPAALTKSTAIENVLKGGEAKENAGGLFNLNA
jgi:hypothetical protein